MAIFWSICTVVGFLVICVVVLILSVVLLIELISLIFEKTCVDYFYILKNGSIAEESYFLPKRSIKTKIPKTFSISFNMHHKLVCNHCPRNLIETHPRKVLRVDVKFKNFDPKKALKHGDDLVKKIKVVIQDRIDTLTLYDEELGLTFEDNFSRELAQIKDDFGLVFIDYNVVITCVGPSFSFEMT